MVYALYEWDDDKSFEENSDAREKMYSNQEDSYGDWFVDIYNSNDGEKVTEKWTPESKRLMGLILSDERLRRDAVSGRNEKLNALMADFVRLLSGENFDECLQFLYTITN